MSDYKRQADGGVVYTGKPEDFSQDMAAAVSRGLELGSMPEATGDPEVTEDVTGEKASAKRRARSTPALEKGVALDSQVG